MSIDWTKPIELLDGTPVRLQTKEEMAGVYGGTNPDRDGDYWIIGMNGEDLGDNSCVPPNGGGIVRNIANPPTDAEMNDCIRHHTPNEDTVEALREVLARTIIRDLLAHAVYDREKSDECAAAVEAAEAFLGQS